MKTLLAVLITSMAIFFCTLLLVEVAVQKRDQRLVDHYVASRMALAVAARKEGNVDLEKRALQAVVAAHEADSDPIGINTYSWSFFSPVVIPVLEAAFSDSESSAVAKQNLVSVAQKRLQEIQ
jgi:hypothetical protein